MLKPFMTPTEVATLLSITRPVVHQMVRRGELPSPVAINARTLRFRTTDIATRFGFDPARLAQQVNQGPPQ